MKSFRSDEGIMFPFALILLMIVLFYVSSYSVRYTVKLNTLDNIKMYYKQEISTELRDK
ncbi:hypothetical protein GCM10007190_11300 [Macrococcus hajekii]|nr:hypothetical protein GCM10007190_11300 [Macrococcus hajekii]